jgi:hypothetical protein
MYLRRQHLSDKLTFATGYPAILFCLWIFLAYKNGFTRNDSYHNEDFFGAMPLFMLFIAGVTDLSKSKVAYVSCIVTILLSAVNLYGVQFNSMHRTESRGFLSKAYVNQPLHYFDNFFKKQPDPRDIGHTIPPVIRNGIGDATVDVFPIDVWLAQLNDLNYSPRPVLQSYSAYCGVFDSLNAMHFYGTDRPEYLLSWTWSIDQRYPAWDESMTKAMIHLNYDYAGYVSLKNETVLSNDYGNYLVFKAKPGTRESPKFEKLYEKTVLLNDTIHINFPGDAPIYMSADIAYTAAGTIHTFISQPPLLEVTLFFDSACTSGAIYRAVKPIIENPVLINKYIGLSTDFLNFVSGALSYDRDIKAFSFHADPKEVRSKITLTFYRFSNY